MGDFITDYIKSIENPDRIGWNGKVWGAPTLKGYDANQRGYGIDIRYNNAAKNLVKNRKGQWLTDKEVTDLMNQHLQYITGVAKRKIKGFNTFSPKKQAAILGMLYRGDSVQSNVNVNKPNDNDGTETEDPRLDVEDTDMKWFKNPETIYKLVWEKQTT